MLPHHPSVRGKEKNGTIKRATLTLDDAYDKENPSFLSGSPQGIASRTGHIQGAFVIAFEIIPPLWLTKAHPCPKVQTCGIGRYKTLWHDNELGPLSRCLVYKEPNLFNGRFPIEYNRAILDYRGTNDAHFQLLLSAFYF
jgi:hypothetical protein